MSKYAISDLATNRPFAGGFYTPTEVARLLRLSGTGTINGWLGGTGNTKPTLVRQYPQSTDIGFWDLMEIRFVSYFRGQNVSLQNIRKAAIRARERFSVDHPFALSNVTFKTDRKTIFAQVAHEEKDKELEELTTGQLSFYEVVEDFLARGVEFDPSSGLAKIWYPEPAKYPSVGLSPKIAHGQPSVLGARIPTRALFLSWKAEGFKYSSTADWFEVEENDVRQAVDYELELDV